jgi:hypothetical protein
MFVVVVVVVGFPFGSIDVMGLCEKKNSCALSTVITITILKGISFFFFLWLLGLLMQTFTAQGVEKGAQSNI